MTIDHTSNIALRDELCNVHLQSWVCRVVASVTGVKEIVCLIPSLQDVVASGGYYGCSIYLSSKSQHFLGLFTGRLYIHTLILGLTSSLPILSLFLSLAICLSVSAPPPPCGYLSEVSCVHVHECVEGRGQAQVSFLRLSQLYFLRQGLSVTWNSSSRLG